MVLDLCKLLNTVYIYEHFDYETYLGMVVVELKSDRGNVKYRGNWEENNDSWQDKILIWWNISLK